MVDAFESGGGVAVVASRAITLTGITLVLGAITFREVVVRRLADPARRDAEGARAGPSVVGIVGALLAVLMAPLRLALQSMALSDGSLSLVGDVSTTAWGLGVIVQGVFGTLALIGFVLGRTRTAGWRLAMLAAVVLSVTPALTGHAVAAKVWWVVSMLSDWAHVIAAGGWIGTLVVLTLEVRRDAAARAPGERAALLIEGFHPIALSCATTVLATGVVSLLLRVPHPFRDLWPSVWADVLLWKLAPIGMIAVFGALHGWKGAARARAKGARQVAGTLLWECIFAAIVLVVTAQLVGTAPPGAG